MEVRPASRRRPLRIAIAIVIALTAVACDGDGDELVVGPDAYSLAIRDFLPEPAGEDEDRPVVYVAHVSDEPFALDDQVAMIDAVAETHDLRFVDEFDAAFEDVDGERRLRDGGLILALGPIPSSPPHLVRVELLRDGVEVSAHLLTLTPGDERWSIESSEPVEPEVLVGDE